ncbi:MAG: amidohydrolase family protein [Pseudomonadales bacterium]|nr:amidohydrolase family protein [Pseudomonadales bacterium]
MNIIQDNSDIESWMVREKPEAVLEPDLPIIDPHHHLWDKRRDPRESHSFRQALYLYDEISTDIAESGHNVVQTVFAQCGAFYRADGPPEMSCVGETEVVNGVAAMSRSGIYGDVRLCTGIFGTADLRLGSAVEPVLEAHLHASKYFRGIRSAFPSDLNDTFLDGFALLGKHNLSYDNWSPDYLRLPGLANLANKFPETMIIVNHLGGRIDPTANESDISDWRRCIDAVAACPNTVMKVGGAQMRIGDWEPPYHMHQIERPNNSEFFCETLLPWYQYAIEAFGPERCMFESNFPVDRECLSYRACWNLFKRIAATLGLSEAEKTAMFSGTAAQVYRLTPP